MPSRIAGDESKRSKPYAIEPVGSRRKILVFAEPFMYTQIEIELAENERIVGVEGLSGGYRLLWVERSEHEE